MTCRQAVALAHYRCSRCKHDWRERPTWKVSCPNCGELYVEWTNYDHDFARTPSPRADVAASMPSGGDTAGPAGIAAAGPASVPSLGYSSGLAGGPGTPSSDRMVPAAASSEVVDLPVKSEQAGSVSPEAA